MRTKHPIIKNRWLTRVVLLVGDKKRVAARVRRAIFFFLFVFCSLLVLTISSSSPRHQDSRSGSRVCLQKLVHSGRLLTYHAKRAIHSPFGHILALTFLRQVKAMQEKKISLGGKDSRVDDLGKINKKKNHDRNPDSAQKKTYQTTEKGREGRKNRQRKRERERARSGSRCFFKRSFLVQHDFFPSSFVFFVFFLLHGSLALHPHHPPYFRLCDSRKSIIFSDICPLGQWDVRSKGKEVGRMCRVAYCSVVDGDFFFYIYLVFMYAYVCLPICFICRP